MRVLLLLLLIALFPLRSFASEQMQTHMGVMGLHHAAMNAAMTAAMNTAVQTSGAPAESAQADDASAAAQQSSAKPHVCCNQCSSCELCHLLLAQVTVPTLTVAKAQPPLPPTLAIRFASADVRRAHKPPLSA